MKEFAEIYLIVMVGVSLLVVMIIVFRHKKNDNNDNFKGI
jgi:cbb3-type cytochrome oxidase subunit 3